MRTIFLLFLSMVLTGGASIRDEATIPITVLGLPALVEVVTLELRKYPRYVLVKSDAKYSILVRSWTNTDTDQMFTVAVFLHHPEKSRNEFIGMSMGSQSVSTDLRGFGPSTLFHLETAIGLFRNNKSADLGAN